jgi:secondary thiamine-phosphate synthase enzyme
MIASLHLSTPSHTALLDVTGLVQQVVRQTGVTSGLCQVFVPHTTAGLTINENADPDVRRDILVALDRLAPPGGDYQHGGGNSPAHIKASLMGFSLTVPIQDGRLLLGDWQGITFCEFDGPRHRTLVVQVIGGSVL